MRLRSLACALVFAAFNTAAAQALSPALRAMEGDWAKNCSEAADNGFNARYGFEFARSGGSIKFDDGIDLWWRGTITAIDAEAKEAVFTYSAGSRRPAGKIRAKLLPDGRLEVGEPGRQAPEAVLVLCAKPDHRVVEKLRWQQISSLTPSRSRFIYFVDPDSTGCLKAEEYLHFDLIGPARYSVWGYGGAKDTSWRVERAADDNGTVRLDLSGDSGRTTIRVTFPDRSHIRIEPWARTFLRCEE